MQNSALKTGHSESLRRSSHSHKPIMLLMTIFHSFLLSFLLEINHFWGTQHIWPYTKAEVYQRWLFWPKPKPNSKVAKNSAFNRLPKPKAENKEKCHDLWGAFTFFSKEWWRFATGLIVHEIVHLCFFD